MTFIGSGSYAEFEVWLYSGGGWTYSQSVDAFDREASGSGYTQEVPLRGASRVYFRAVSCRGQIDEIFVSPHNQG